MTNALTRPKPEEIKALLDVTVAADATEVALQQRLANNCC